MSFSVADLKLLAREYHFDIEEARAFLGKETKKRGRPTKKDKDSDIAPKKPTKATASKPTSGKRGPSGYNLFVKNQGVSITEAAKQWKSLSDSGRAKWNAKAKV
jgi:hypothetical protein